MNICIISNDYPYQDRMVFVFVQQLVEAMVDEGVKVDVIAAQSLIRSLIRGVKLMPKKQRYTTNKGNEYLVFRPFALSFGNGNKILYRLAKSFNQSRIERCLNAINPQIVYGHFWHNAMKGANYARLNGTPLFVACGEGDDALDNWASHLLDSEKQAIRKLVKGVISVSTENKRKCLSYGLSSDGNTIVLPNCVNDEVFHPLDSSKTRKELGANSDDFVISYTGAFIERKGYNRLAEAIEKMDDKRVKVIFSGKPMDGHKDDMPKCKGIIHCGAVNHDDLPKYLCASDLFVLPTLKEGCCNAIVEALACGVPVISSNRPFNDDILNEDNSLRINPESVDEIADAITKLMVDKEKYNSMKQYALNHSGDYSIDARARKIIAFIKSKI